MLAKIDYTYPSLVVVGHWNTAILNEPGWIAKYILDVPEGDSATLRYVTEDNRVGWTQFANQASSVSHIWLFEKFGMGCGDQRLEMFTRDIGNLQPLYDTVTRLNELFPHTPMEAVGVNFSMRITEDLAVITPKFETQEDELCYFGDSQYLERIDAFNLDRKSTLELDDIGRLPTTLNLARSTDFYSAKVNFNYHITLGDFELGESDLLAALVAADPISFWQTHAKKLMKDVYYVDEFEETYY